MRRLRHQLSCCAHHYHRRHYRRPQQQLPPAEWVEPYLDTGTTTPSPWLSRVISLVLRTSSSSFSPESLAADLAAFCRTFLVRLSPSFVSVALRSPSLLHQPLLSLHFFHAWSNSTTLNPNSRHHHAALLDCYVTLISSFSSNSGAKTHVIDLVADMRRRADAGQLHLRYLSPSAAAALIRSLAALALVEELLWAWKAMKLAGVEPSVVTYNCLLDGLVSGGFAATADKVFDAMPVRPDVVSYNTLIKGYCRAGGRARDAMVRFEEMQRQKPALAPDKVTYLTLMQCHYNEGMLPQCVSLYQEMEEREELDIPPHAYAVVIGALCKDGKPFEGLAVLERMHKRGCPANVATYTALIDALGKCGREKEAMALFERMKADGLEPDEVTYGVVLNCLCKCQRLDEAMECFRRCIEQGVRVNAIFYASLIDGFGKAGMANQAWELFEEMVEKGFVPDAYCYNVLIDAFVKAGRVDDSYSLYERMESAGCDQTVYTYTILIDGLFREHKNEEALKLWDVMIDKGIAPTAAAFRTLATGLCLSGKFTRACKILDELAPMGVVPETAHEDMINVLCKAGRFKQACKLADGIVQKGREIPGRVRTMMINALRKAGNADLAIKLVHSKIGIGYERSGSIKRRVKFQTLFD